MPDFHVFIPARLESTRLPQKPLIDLNGIPMIVRVAQIALQSNAQSVVVACDDEKILHTCQQHNIAAVLTDKHHQNGTERLAQALKLQGFLNDEIIVNLQGDEPLMNPEALNLVATTLEKSGAAMATLATPFKDFAAFQNPNNVKVVANQKNEALYFSRAAIPFSRDNPHALPCAAFKHIGLYAYRAAFVKRFLELPPSPLEKIEMLEQLRTLWHGEKIALAILKNGDFVGVDTLEDALRVRQILKSRLKKRDFPR